jgi:hypothetical protein
MASRTSSDVLSAKRDRPIKPQKILPAKAHNPVLQHNHPIATESQICRERRDGPTSDMSKRSNSQLHLRSVYGLAGSPTKTNGAQYLGSALVDHRQHGFAQGFGMLHERSSAVTAPNWLAERMRYGPPPPKIRCQECRPFVVRLEARVSPTPSA